MRILGIETSCDETAVSIIEVSDLRKEPRIKILSNIVSSQAKLHAKFGGVVPNLAKREHQKNLVPVLMMALHQAGLSQSAKRKAPDGERFALSDLRLAAILEREPELFARLAGALAKRARIREHILPLKPPRIDAIAVTIGPGLAPALWVGVNFARALSYLWGKPLIPVNHLEGHIVTNLLPTDGKSQIANRKSSRALGHLRLTICFPALCLIVSGGHTELVLMKSYGKYKIIGETLDDAAGEAFDKVAKMMGLGFPGGPKIAAEAAKVQNDARRHPEPRWRRGEGSRDPSVVLLHAGLPQDDGERQLKFKISLPRPMIGSKDFNFSFSGLKTAVLYSLRDLLKKHTLGAVRPIMAREFQNAVVDVLISKTVRAAKKFRVKTVMIGGGVAANVKLRSELGDALAKTLPAISYKLPAIPLTGDNALMIALAGWFGKNKKTGWQSLQAKANLRLSTPH